MTPSWLPGLAYDVFYLYITSSTMSKKLQDDGETATATLPPATHSPQHTIKTNRSIWKDSDFQNLVGRQTHTNFTITDRCSGLSITSGRPRRWRVFERARSISLTTHTMIHGKCRDRVECLF